MAEQSLNVKSRKILFLEDEDVLGNLYCKKLEEAGHQVKLCKDPEQLLNTQKEFDAEVAFLDQALHGENTSGMDMIPILKAHKPDIKIAMLSNYSEFHMKEEAKKAGAHDYLLKINTTPAQLVHYVDRLFA